MRREETDRPLGVEPSGSAVEGGPDPAEDPIVYLKEEDTGEE